MNHQNYDYRVLSLVTVVPMHAWNAYREVEVYLHLFLTLTLDESEWSASLPGRDIPGEAALGTYCI